MTDSTIRSRDTDAPASDVPSSTTSSPPWMVPLVVILLAGILGTGGLVARRLIEQRDASDPAAIAISRYAGEVGADPSDTGARLNLAYAYQQAARYDAAVAEYGRVLRADPKNVAALYNEGVIAAVRGDGAGAEALWARVLKIEPAHVLAATSLGERLAAQRRYRELVAAVGPAAAANPALADLQYLLGSGLEGTGQTGPARERYAAALRYSPEMAEARAGLQRLGGAKP